LLVLGTAGDIRRIHIVNNLVARRRPLRYSDRCDLHGLNWLAVFIIQQFGAVADRGGAPFTQNHVAIAFRMVYGMAAVLALPSLELAVRILYHRNSGCHEIPQRPYCRALERAERLPRTTHGWRAANNFKTGRLEVSVQTPRDYSFAHTGSPRRFT
jgi:hypothetical protein